jgi:hypothetical protein
MMRPVIQPREKPLYGGAALTTLGSIVAALISLRTSAVALRGQSLFRPCMRWASGHSATSTASPKPWSRPPPCCFAGWG